MKKKNKRISEVEVEVAICDSTLGCEVPPTPHGHTPRYTGTAQLFLNELEWNLCSLTKVGQAHDVILMSSDVIKYFWMKNSIWSLFECPHFNKRWKYIHPFRTSCPRRYGRLLRLISTAQKILCKITNTSKGKSAKKNPKLYSRYDIFILNFFLWH